MACSPLNFISLADAVSRRDLFTRVGGGLAGIALASLLDGESASRAEVEEPVASACGSFGEPHFPPKANAVIQLFQHGGPSQMDLLDPKPELNKRDGQPMPDSFTDLVKISAHGGLMGVPYKFIKSGQCGTEFSEILPHTSKCADDIAVIRSMYTEHNNHEQALWMMHTGRVVSGRPTIGAWVDYALGSANHNLPAYVVLRHDSAMPVDGSRNWSSGFLPPRHQGVHFRHNGEPVMYLHPESKVPDAVQRLRLGLLQRLNAQHRAAHPEIGPQLDARIASYELAGRMQVAAAAALDLSQETAETQKLYGLDNPKCASYGRRCLMARRLVERGVRFVQIFIHGQIWDTHSNNAAATKSCCEETDQPTAALLTDLKRRGLLDQTLVTWGGEFGRTPVSQGGNGRDHHKQGFSMWLAGGGIRGGQVYGATDEFAYYAVEKPVKVADLHATILHLLGLNHQRVTYHLHGRDERLTDVYDAQLLKPLLA